MYKKIHISEFLRQVKCPVSIEPDKEYSLVTVKLHHKGVVLREKKKGSMIGSKMHRVSEGQFILSGIDARNGAFGFIPKELDGAIVTNDFWVLNFDERIVKREFFYWLTNTPLFLDVCIRASRGETQRIRLQKNLFLNYALQIPPIKHQTRFLQRITSVDSLLEKLNRELDTQNSYIMSLKKTILQEAIEGKLTADWRRDHPSLISGDNHASKLLGRVKTEKERLIKEGEIKKEKPLAHISDDEKPFELPEGWVWCRLGDLGTTQTGSTPSTTDKANFGDYIPFIKPADITITGINYHNEGLSEKGLAVGRIIPNNSILMVCIGGSTGKAYFTNHDVSCNQQINAITPLANIEAPFLLQFLQSSYFQNKVWGKAMKSSTPIINKGKWASIPIPLPPELEQRVILEQINQIMTGANELEKQVIGRKELSEKLMQPVLREAFSTS